MCIRLLKIPPTYSFLLILHTTCNHGDCSIPTNSTTPQHSILTTDPDLAECLLVHPIFYDDGNLPFQFSTIADYQQHDHTVAQLPTTNPENYRTKNIGGCNIIALCNNDQQMIITDSMLQKLI